MSFFLIQTHSLVLQQVLATVFKIYCNYSHFHSLSNNLRRLKNTKICFNCSPLILFRSWVGLLPLCEHISESHHHNTSCLHIFPNPTSQAFLFAAKPRQMSSDSSLTPNTPGILGCTHFICTVTKCAQRHLQSHTWMRIIQTCFCEVELEGECEHLVMKSASSRSLMLFATAC